MRKMSDEMLQKFPYPNLMAEIIESHYSICTLGKRMDIGNHCEEDDPEVWARLKGDHEISTSEAIGLAGLFGVKLEYLFSNELKMIGDKTYAYWRWLDYNEQREREYKEYKTREKIEWALKDKPFLLEVVSRIIDMNEVEAFEVMAFIKKEGAA